jgi:hypothetical protein
MKTITLLASLALTLALTLQAEDQYPAADAPGFVHLHNGKDVTGWQTTGNWVVEPDGNIALKPCAGEKRTCPAPAFREMQSCLDGGRQAL